MAQSFDVIVIGAGLTGLSLAHQLNRRGYKTILVEKEAVVGSVQRGAAFHDEKIENGLRLIQSGTAEGSVKNFTTDFFRMLDLPIPSEKSIPISVFQGHEEKEFFGFGAETPAAYDELSYFLNAFHGHFDCSVAELIEILEARYDSDTLLRRSHVTGFLFENNEVQGVVINQNQKILAPRLIYTPAPASLLDLIRHDALPLRFRQKITKVKTWSCLCLDYWNPEFSGEEKAFVAQTVTADEPLILLAKRKGALWQWVTFFTEDDIEDTDALGSLVKKAKRQIKRAIPLFFEKKPLERVCVFDHVGQLSHPDLGSELLPGLTVASPLASKQANLNGVFEIVAKTLDAFPPQVVSESAKISLA